MSLWTDFLGARVEWVEAGGVATRVVTAGAAGGAAPLVLLHGRGGHLESWRANLVPLARTRRVIAFDLLGHGLTGRHDGGYGIAELAAHATAVLDALDIGSAVLAGQSIGGWVGARIALERPELVRALALIEPAGLQSEAQRLADPRVAAAFERGGRAFAEPTADAVRTRLAGLVADPASIDDELVQTRRALYAPEAARAVHRAVRAADNSAALLDAQALATLRERGLPLLLIRGEHGHTPAAVVAQAAQTAGAQLHTLPGAKQWPQLERPGAVNDLLDDFATTHGRT
ncbi:alpha/beta fold hydrolase [Conexibacter sp. JD483]|uniref:alpha/beta fold hydrolase n=1 Tax=unclassified Conexibacter TaxID=2627773 RepID=UPI0027257EF4|nr:MULTISPECIES: alpha/beta fold hydrolase [unclassified Conexibacter]MDO8188699.1 alpha/beta fold hydrolase [Conexibacter sp. CPCC 205706]MDO8201565.1 alpha/beta fold hydrolase [Conexibacter sp. CPCC 205762]MDR9371656.1 alpha/beta fold hydrolase [Conexibacter sp. JD483]